MSYKFWHDLSGHKFGRLTVLSFHPCAKTKTYWSCICDCGTETVVRADILTSGSSQSCGCLVADSRHSTHGRTNTPEYRAWLHMKQRCFNPSFKNYHRWGGRGITICDRWIDSFENFYADLGDKPSKSHSLDRADNDGNYTPENCRWATREEQDNNRSDSRLITYKGETMTATQWGKRLDVNPRMLTERLSRGWSIEKTLGQASERHETTATKEILKSINMPTSTYYNRIRKGWSHERAVTVPIKRKRK